MVKLEKRHEIAALAQVTVINTAEAGSDTGRNNG